MAALQPDGLLLAAFLPSEDPRDVLIAAGGMGELGSFADVPPGATIATVALQRQALLCIAAPTSGWNPYGNIDTRLRKLDDGAADAIILASAGLSRLGVGDIGVTIAPEDFAARDGPRSCLHRMPLAR